MASDRPTMSQEQFNEFRAFSAQCGRDPLRVQGAGGNTSIKDQGSMWIKASGTELADALDGDIFVEVDLAKAKAEALGAGDGTCKSAVVDPSVTLRPSIETTFHALLDWRVVAHTHSVNTLVHAISPQGIAACAKKLDGLPFTIVPYRKPGRPLTNAILEGLAAQQQIFVLANHGLIVAGDTVTEVASLMEEVERRLQMPIVVPSQAAPGGAPVGFQWFDNNPFMGSRRLVQFAQSGSFYPDHVVFLGPALPPEPMDGAPACMMDGAGLAIRTDASPAQRAMAGCLADVLMRLPDSWEPTPIGSDAEAELLDWDAEKYRQALAKRNPK
ncbi:MAG: class II aldolase/adducin family protein [Pseudomonadota bacterium]